MISEHAHFRHSDKKPVKMTKFDEVANFTKSDQHEFTIDFFRLGFHLFDFFRLRFPFSRAATLRLPFTTVSDG